jgi:hypothetical protein
MLRSQAGVNTWKIVATSSVAVPSTNTISEETLATVTLPAGAMGPNGVLRITTLWTFNNNANVKTPRIRLGGVSGSIIYAPAGANQVNISDMRIVRNRNAQNSQISQPISGIAFNVTTGTAFTGAVDTSAAVDIVFSSQKATGTDTLTLESYMVEVYYGA